MIGRRWLLPSGLGVLTAGLLYGWLVSQAVQEPVLVAVHDVAVGDMIGPEDVRTEWMVAGQAGSILRAPAAAVGQRARVGLVAGQQVLAGHIAPGGALSGGMGHAERAVLIPASAGGSWSGTLASGDRVDLIWVRDSGAEWLARNVRVLHAATDEQAGGVVVAVPEEAAPAVAAATMRGEVTLCLTPLQKEGS